MLLLMLVRHAVHSVLPRTAGGDRAGDAARVAHPRQVRVIPAARPGSRPPLPAVPAASGPTLIPTVTAAVGCRGPGPFRGPAKQHPLQHHQLGVHPPELAIPGGQLLSEPGDLLPLPLHQRRQPLVRLQRLRQRTLQARERIRFREHTASSHEPQQTPAHTGNHARPAPGVSHPGRRTPNRAPGTRLPTTYVGDWAGRAGTVEEGHSWIQQARR